MFYANRTHDVAARSMAREAKTDARGANSEIEFLKRELERQLMISEALWTFIQEKHGLDDQDLFDRVLEIDMKDGKADGKVAKSGPKKCSACGRTLPRKRNFCIYCGEVNVRDPFER